MARKPAVKKKPWENMSEADTNDPMKQIEILGLMAEEEATVARIEKTKANIQKAASKVKLEDLQIRSAVPHRVIVSLSIARETLLYLDDVAVGLCCNRGRALDILLGGLSRNTNSPK